MEHKVAESKTCSMQYVSRSKNKNDLERILSLIIDNQVSSINKCVFCLILSNFGGGVGNNTLHFKSFLCLFTNFLCPIFPLNNFLFETLCMYQHYLFDILRAADEQWFTYKYLDIRDTANRTWAEHNMNVSVETGTVSGSQTLTIFFDEGYIAFRNHYLVNQLAAWVVKIHQSHNLAFLVDL